MTNNIRLYSATRTNVLRVLWPNMVKRRNIWNNKTFYIRVQNISTLYSCRLEVNKYFKNQLLVSNVYL